MALLSDEEIRKIISEAGGNPATADIAAIRAILEDYEKTLKKGKWDKKKELMKKMYLAMMKGFAGKLGVSFDENSLMYKNYASMIEQVNWSEKITDEKLKLMEEHWLRKVVAVISQK